MKTTIKITSGLLISHSAVLLLFGACAHQPAPVDGANTMDIMGQTDLSMGQEMTPATVEQAQPRAELANIDHDATAQTITAPEVVSTQVQSLQGDVPLQVNPNVTLGSNVDPFYYSSIPYYCNPYKYPYHIRSAIRACAPYLNDLLGTSHGYYRKYPRFLRKWHHGYRVKRHVGRVSSDDDDDDDNRRRRRRRHRR